MKKILVICLIVALCGAAALAEGVGIANPWVDATAEAVMQALGVEFALPDGATNVSYSMLPEAELAELRFTWYDMDYTARIQPTEAFEDISGLYYEWDIADDCRIQGCDGRVMRANEEDGSIDLCLWYDDAAGLMYAVSAAGKDLDGFDITAAAEAIYLPATSE